MILSKHFNCLYFRRNCFFKFWTFRFVCLFKCSSAFSVKSAAKYPHRVLTCFFVLILFFIFEGSTFVLLYFDSFVGTISVGSSNLLNPSVTVKVKNQKIFEKKKTFNHLFLLTKFYLHFNLETPIISMIKK